MTNSVFKSKPAYLYTDDSSLQPHGENVALLSIKFDTTSFP